MKVLTPIPSWLESVLEHRVHFTTGGLGGLLDHYRVTNALGEALAQKIVTPDTLQIWLTEQVGKYTTTTLAVSTTDGWTALQVDPRAFWEACWEEILGRKIEVPPPPKLKERTKKAIERYRLLLMFLPIISENDYPDNFVKPVWGRYLDVSKIARKPLPGRWVLIETITKPNWDDPRGYGEDPLGQDLQLMTRFRISWEHLTAILMPQAAKLFGLVRNAVREPTAEEWNLIANLFLWLKANRGIDLPDLGSTKSWEWCLNKFGSGIRLIVGSRDDGGLSDVGGDWSDRRNGSIAFRVLAVL